MTVAATASRDTLVERLRALDTCVLSDALDREGVAGVAYGLVRLSGTRGLAGRVLTVTLGPTDGSIPARHLGTRAVESAGPGDVIVIEHHSTPKCGGWGGILSCAASVRGIDGVIVDGMCRDIDEAVALDFPMFAGGAVPATARGRVQEVAFQEPVSIRGVAVHAGDFVLADGSGIVFVPAAKIEPVLDRAEMLYAREAAMLEAVRRGQPVGSVMNHNYEGMVHK